MTSNLRRLHFVQSSVRRGVEFTQPYRPLLPMIIDSWSWVVALIFGTGLRLGFDFHRSNVPGLIKACVLAVVLQAVGGTITGLYRGRWRIGAFEEVVRLVALWGAVAPVVVFANYVVFGRRVPTTGLFSAVIIALVLMASARMSWRLFSDIARMPMPEGRKRALVFGAGEGGRSVIRSMLMEPASNFLPVALLDDDPSRSRREVSGVRVVGGREAIKLAAETQRATELILAMPSAAASVISELSVLGAQAGLEVHVLPPLVELLGNKPSVRDVRQLTERDLLGRDEVEVDEDSIRAYLTDKVIMVTGAGGSIGAELCRQLWFHKPRRLVMVDRDESALHGVQLDIEGRALLDTPDLIVADIRDRERMFEVIGDCAPEVIFHAAALKHLTLLENHPVEGYKTNVLGTKNVLDAAAAAGTERFVNISTDKAANPTSILGSTKLVAEMLTASASRTAARPYVSVRFGNVLGSRGSVIPTFRAQIARGGPVTVTDADVSRYFMTIHEAVRLVLQAGAIGGEGSTLILDMGEPVKIVDLANRLIAQLDPSVKIEFTGLRTGEKLDEELVATTEDVYPTEHERIVGVRRSWNAVVLPDKMPDASSVHATLQDVIDRVEAG